MRGSGKEVRTIDVKLAEIDAHNVKADVAIVGSRSPLVTSAERASYKRFQRLTLYDEQLARQVIDARLLSTEKGPWSNILAISYNSRRVVSQRAVANLVGTLVAIHQLFRPSRVLMMPLSWRNEDSVALCMLAAIYQFHYYPFLQPFSPTVLDGVEYVICSDDGLSAFRRALASDFGVVREWFDKELSRSLFMCSPCQLNYESLQFSVSTLDS